MSSEKIYYKYTSPDGAFTFFMEIENFSTIIVILLKAVTTTLFILSLAFHGNKKL